MGIEYYLINTSNKTFYDLGKGLISELGCEIDALFDREYLELFLIDDCEYPVEYAKELSHELFEFAKSGSEDTVFLISDCSDDILYIKAYQYKCVGCRYRNSDGSTCFNEIEDNKHLNNKYYTDMYEKDLEIYSSYSGRRYKL